MDATPSSRSYTHWKAAPMRIARFYFSASAFQQSQMQLNGFSHQWFQKQAATLLLSCSLSASPWSCRPVVPVVGGLVFLYEMPSVILSRYSSVRRNSDFASNPVSILTNSARYGCS